MTTTSNTPAKTSEPAPAPADPADKTTPADQAVAADKTASADKAATADKDTPPDKAEQAKVAPVINHWSKAATTGKTTPADKDAAANKTAPPDKAEQAKVGSVFSRWFKSTAAKKTAPADKATAADDKGTAADKAEQAKVASAISNWYKYSKSEQKERGTGKKLWYIAEQLKDASRSSSAISDSKKDDDEKLPATVREIEAVPSYSLRSTAIYSPPYGDRILSGRLELMTDSSGFKFYQPDQRLNQPAGDHTRSTMYKMNTSSKKTPLPGLSSSKVNTVTNVGTGETADQAALPTYVSRGLQTDREPEPSDLSGIPHIRYYEKQQPKVIMIGGKEQSASEPVLPPIQQTPIWVNDIPLPQSSLPTTVKETVPTPALKNSPLSSESHDKALEELRKRNKDTKGGTYRVKKVHILEKNDMQDSQPPPFRRPPLPPAAPTVTIPSKAGESILRSENLFFNRFFFRRKK